MNHVRGDATALPFDDNYFGLVVSNLAIDFCPKESFSEAYRVLKEGQKAIFYFHHPKMLEGNPKNPYINSFWTYLRENNLLFTDPYNIEKTLNSFGFIVKEVFLNQDENNTNFWWETVLEKE